jgi:hypothetical protein
VLALCGADYLAPRNVVAAMVPLSGMIAVIAVSERAGRVGMAVVAVLVVAFVALSVDVNLSPRLQRSDWRGVARELADHVVANGGRVITTVELASAPLEYYLPPLRNAYAGQSVTVREIDETGYAPLRRGAGMAPVRGFVAAGRLEAHGLIIYRFVSALPRKVSVERLLREVITDGRAEVLVPGRGSVGALAP